MNQAGRDVAPWIERLARVGYVATAALYITIGVLAAGAAFGHGRSTDTRGAMATILSAPYGRFLLGIIAFGLVGYAVWRCVSAIVDPEHRGNDAKGIALRLSFFARGIIHLALAWSAAQLAMGGDIGTGDRSKEATNAAMQFSGGIWVVWAVALGFLGAGLYQLFRAATAKLSKQLHQGQARAEVGGWVIALSRFGIAARGLVFLAIGGLLADAAWDQDPAKAGGVDDALTSLARLGPLPYAAIGAGLIAYGVYQLLNARYRRIVASD